MNENEVKQLADYLNDKLDEADKKGKEYAYKYGYLEASLNFVLEGLSEGKMSANLKASIDAHFLVKQHRQERNSKS